MQSYDYDCNNRNNRIIYDFYNFILYCSFLSFPLLFHFSIQLQIKFYIIIDSLFCSTLYYITGTGPSTCTAPRQCINGNCCNLPRCPGGAPATQACTGTGPSTCTGGQLCVSGGCCAGVQQCPGGVNPTDVCRPDNTCPVAPQTCTNGVCCGAVAVTCPDNLPATATCNAPLACANANEYCFNNQVQVHFNILTHITTILYVKSVDHVVGYRH